MLAQLDGLDQLLWIPLGFAAVCLFAGLLSSFGDLMYRKGIASPFYVRGHRLHHRPVIMITFPSGYSAVVILALAGYVQIAWGSIVPATATALAIAAGCVVLDLVLDKHSASLRMESFLHHEWLYLTVPAVLLTGLLRFVL